MIFNDLSTIDKIDSCGRWMHNDDSLKIEYGDDKVRWLNHYRFNLTPENSNARGYVTEKLLEAIQGGCVPIYWGSDSRPDCNVFNKEAIVFFEMGKDNPNTVKFVSELNSDEKNTWILHVRSDLWMVRRMSFGDITRLWRSS